jgi:hypothetical protein
MLLPFATQHVVNCCAAIAAQEAARVVNSELRKHPEKKTVEGEAKSNLEPLGRGQIDAWGYERRVGPWRCALDAAIIGGRACWIEHRYGGWPFVSDRLAALPRQKQLRGFDLHDHCEEIAR